MTRKQSLVLVPLLLALAATQHFGLERLPETRAENALRNLPNVPAGDMLPTYVASLFFGAFRAVAIDVLWIQLKRAEEERRWYERREILKMISYVQPRNPEVWSHLGWHSAYNVANGFTDPEKSWSWVRFGVTWLRQGIRRLPENPHLKFELASTLLHKPSWRDGELDEGLLRRFESDEELLRDLTPDDVPYAPRAMFELARLWFERAKADIEKAGSSRHKTQMGLYIYPSTLDGYSRKTLYLEAIRAWRAGRLEQALERARDVEKHVRAMLEAKYPEGLSSIFQDWRVFYGALPELFRKTHAAERSGRREDLLEALRVFQELAGRWDWPLDDGFLWSRSNARAPLHVLKRAIVGDADEGECNDAFAVAWDIPEGTLGQANLAPAGLDVDWYWLTPPRPPGAAGQRPPAKAMTYRLLFQRPPASGAELKVSIFDDQKKLLRVDEVKGKAEIDVPAAQYVRYSVKVEPKDPAAPPPADSRYFFQWRVVE